jgi:sterol desaturase/sphingolipid hydroxylase (fatty acid hydroxylase superfamily)
VGYINWFAVVLAALVAGALALVWFGPLFGQSKKRKVAPGRVMSRARPERIAALSAVLLLVTSTMLGHMFARVGAETLSARPWLYFMMSGGLATAFVIPALWISFSHIRVPTRVAIIDAGYWLFAYLAMGSVFFLAG